MNPLPYRASGSVGGIEVLIASNVGEDWTFAGQMNIYQVQTLPTLELIMGRPVINIHRCSCVKLHMTCLHQQGWKPVLARLMIVWKNSVGACGSSSNCNWNQKPLMNRTRTKTTPLVQASIFVRLWLLIFPYFRAKWNIFFEWESFTFSSKDRTPRSNSFNLENTWFRWKPKGR